MKVKGVDHLTLVKVGNFGFDLFQMEPGDPPKTDTRHLHFAFQIDQGDLDKVQEARDY